MPTIVGLRLNEYACATSAKRASRWDALPAGFSRTSKMPNSMASSNFQDAVRVPGRVKGLSAIERGVEQAHQHG
ncbi:MAG TPA: hypothetical protein VG204_15680 [Terriglobia bacterium]|nr:hypothetical protein [Terriglobia bacterium]